MLLRQWERWADTLMERDGDNPKFKNGGHRIKHDPLLIQAIEEIRDGYYRLFHHRQHLQRMLKNEPSNNELEVALNDTDYDLIAWSKQSYERLQSPAYGCNPDDVTTAGLSIKDAGLIVGTIIKRSILSYHNAFQRDGIERPFVPHVPLKGNPEQFGRHRSGPAPDWAERIHTPASSGPGQVDPGNR